MTINGSYVQQTQIVIRAYAYVGVTAASQRDTPPSPPAPSDTPPRESVAFARSTTPQSAAASATYRRPSPRDRAEQMIDVLDANGDDILSEEEFVEGAKALLARADRADDHDHGAHVGRGRRLERKLEKLFERLDRNDDGAVDRAELTSALRRFAGKPRAVRPTDVDTPPTPLPKAAADVPSATASVAPAPTPTTTAGAAVVDKTPTADVAPERALSSYRFVSIAVTQYTAVAMSRSTGPVVDKAA